MARVSPGRLAGTYGQALFAACIVEQFDSISAQLKELQRMFRESSQISEALKSRTVSSDQKREFVEEMANRLGLGQEVMNFLRLLAEGGRFALFDQMIISFEDAVREFRHILSVEVIVARSLSKEEERLLEDRLRSVVNPALAITIRVDQDILGGLLIRSGDSVFDSSLKTRLRRLEDSLAAPA
jgi:F-type H+-transporting ATPase subunit delta